MQPHGVALAAKHEGAVAERDMPGIEWHPAKRLLSAPAQPRLLMLPSRLIVFETNSLDRVRVKVEALLRGTGSQCNKVIAGQPSASVARCLLLRLIAVVEDEVDRTRLSIQTLGVFVSKAIFEGQLHRFVPALYTGFAGGAILPLPEGRGLPRISISFKLGLGH